MNKLQTSINCVLRSATGAIKSTPINSLLVESGFTHINDRFCLSQYKLLAKHLLDPSSVLFKPLKQYYYQLSPNTKSALSCSLHLLDNLEYSIPLPREQTQSSFPPWSDISNAFITRTESYSKRLLDSSCFQKLHTEIRSSFSDFSSLYTDASKTDGKTSFAVVQQTSYNNFTVKASGLLVPMSSILVAETYALLQAVILANYNNQKTIIFSDSLSSLKSIRNSRNSSYMCRQIRQVLISSKGKIKLCWIPCHCGIIGNELADKSAKAVATSDASNIIFPPSESLLVSIGKREIMDSRQSLWLQEKSYLSSHWKTISQPDYKTLTRQQSVVLLRMRTGHTRLTHSYLFKKESPQSAHPVLLTLP